MNIEQKIRIVGSAFDALLKSKARGIVSAGGGTANCMAGETALFFGIGYAQSHHLLDVSLPENWYELLDQECGLKIPPYFVSSDEMDDMYNNADDIPEKWLECLRQAREGVQP